MEKRCKYNFFKNGSYAISGLIEIFKNEKSFRIELFSILPLSIFSYYLNVNIIEHIFLVLSLLFILCVECLNSSIERCVDLACMEHHDLAKSAKDAGSAAVLISICMAVFTWGIIIWNVIC